MLNEQQILNNYNDLMKNIESFIINDNRKGQLIQLYETLKDRIMLMPASAYQQYHNSFAGGYCDHILMLLRCTEQVLFLWNKITDKPIIDLNATDEIKNELMFVALTCELGKVGTMEDEYFLPNESEWHRKNQGKMFVINPKLEYMSIPDRSLFLLQQNNIQISHNEFLGIKLSEGLYDENNRSYFVQFEEDKKLKTNIPYIISQAREMAIRLEFEKYINSKDTTKNNVVTKQIFNKKQESANIPVTNATKLFDELFKK